MMGCSLWKRRIDAVAPAVFCAISMALSLCGCASTGKMGCSPKGLRQILSSIPYCERHVDWMTCALSQYGGDRLITIYTDPEWGGYSALDRRVENGVVVCDRYTQAHEDPNAPHGFYSERVYCVRDDGAREMFHLLYDQVSLGYKYRSPTWRSSSNPGGVYSFTCGSKTGLTVDEDGALECILPEVMRFRTRLALEEEIKDASLAYGYFDPDAVASIAGYITFAVHYFDTLCEVAWIAEQNLDKGRDSPSPTSQEVQPSK